LANDPCGLVPDTGIPAGLPMPHQHAVYHVVGRIRHRLRPKTVHAHLAPDTTGGAGCEKHYVGTAVVRTPLLPSGAGAGLLGGASLAAAGGLGFVFGQSTPHGRKTIHKPPANGKDGTPVPEPSSALVFLSAAVIALAARRLGVRARGRQLATAASAKTREQTKVPVKLSLCMFFSGTYVRNGSKASNHNKPDDDRLLQTPALSPPGLPANLSRSAGAVTGRFAGAATRAKLRVPQSSREVEHD